MDFVSFGWALAGGVMIGAAAALLLALNGKIAGVSGILGGLVAPRRGDVAWRALFVVGLLAGGLVAFVVAPERFDASGAPALPLVAIAGVLVGVGTRIGNGCTSGHGVCGISRLAPRSIVATLAFMLTGALTVLVVRSLGGA
ncbi:YeeE/YedE family protein [Sandaracinus amylolyticus]|nr:YeeE/YedE thiosulfate transporter family protein [Sandaracinus amylolyticus]